MKKSETEKKTETLDNNILVGYVRRSNAGGALKLSINTAAFADCSTYMTSDGQAYVPLVISMTCGRPSETRWAIRRAWVRVLKAVLESCAAWTLRRLSPLT